MRFATLIADLFAENRGRRVAFPATINEIDIQNVLDSNQNVPPTVLRVFGSRHRYFPLISMEARNIEYHLFMLCKVVGHDNCLIWFATTKNGTIFDFESIAAYNKSVSYEETSQIRLNEDEIHVETVRRVKNPFEQINRMTHQYNILASGEVHQEDN